MTKRTILFTWTALFLLVPFANSAPDDVRELFLKINGHEVYVAYTGDVEVAREVLLAIHGSGREANSYIPDHAKANTFYVTQRDLALKNGYIFTVVSNGRDTWGTNQGLNTLLDVYRCLQRRFNIQKRVTLWASSAGGVLMYRMIREHPDIVDKALGTFPVYDLEAAWLRLKSARKAWPDTIAFTEVNPATYPSDLCSTPILIFHGAADSAVPVEQHSGRLVNDLQNYNCNNVQLVIVPGGHSTENRELYNEQIIDDFLSNDR